MLKYRISFKTGQVQICPWRFPGDQTRKNTPIANQSAWFSESAMVENFLFLKGNSNSLPRNESRSTPQKNRTKLINP